MADVDLAVPPEPAPPVTPPAAEPVTPESAKEVPVALEAPVQVPEAAVSDVGQTAQMPADEPIGVELAGQATKSTDSPVDGPFDTAHGQPQTSEVQPATPPTPAPPSAPVVARSPRDLLPGANIAKQGRIKLKLDKIVEFLKTKGEVTNDDVEKLLHVSDSTATRYLSALEKDGKIRQVGKTGSGVVYTRI